MQQPESLRTDNVKDELCDTIKDDIEVETEPNFHEQYEESLNKQNGNNQLIYYRCDNLTNKFYFVKQNILICAVFLVVSFDIFPIISYLIEMSLEGGKLLCFENWDIQLFKYEIKTSWG